MAKKQTEVISHVFGRDVRPLAMVAEDCVDYGALSQVGINLPQGFVRDQIRSMGLDGMAMDDVVIGSVVEDPCHNKFDPVGDHDSKFFAHRDHVRKMICPVVVNVTIDRGICAKR